MTVQRLIDTLRNFPAESYVLIRTGKLADGLERIADGVRDVEIFQTPNLVCAEQDIVILRAECTMRVFMLAEDQGVKRGG